MSINILKFKRLTALASGPEPYSTAEVHAHALDRYDINNLLRAGYLERAGRGKYIIGERAHREFIELEKLLGRVE